MRGSSIPSTMSAPNGARQNEGGIGDDRGVNRSKNIERSSVPPPWVPVLSPLPRMNRSTIAGIDGVDRSWPPPGRGVNRHTADAGDTPPQHRSDRPVRGHRPRVQRRPPCGLDRLDADGFHMHNVPLALPAVTSENRPLHDDRLPVKMLNDRILVKLGDAEGEAAVAAASSSRPRHRSGSA